MCGRVHIKTNLDDMLRGFSFVKRTDEVDRLSNGFPLYNGAPGLDYPIIIRDVVRDAEQPILGPVFRRANWGLVPSWAKERTPNGQRPPINARAETIAQNGMFRDAYHSRRALMPITGYFEWQDIHGTGKNKQPYAIGMKDDSPFVLAAIWESWRDRRTGVDFMTFAIVTCEPNVMMARIHDRMPVILPRASWERWLSDEPDPRDLLKPFPSELMKMWPIGRKVGKNDYNAADVLDEVEPDKPEPPKPPKAKKISEPPAQGSLF